MALTLTCNTHPETETVDGMEVCSFCATLINARLATDRHGGVWSISPTPPSYEVARCDFCHTPLGTDRMSAAVTL